MMRYGLVILLIAAVAAGCSGDDGPCPPCGAGQICNTDTGQCEASSDGGAGACSPGCGPNATCDASSKTCSCAVGWSDCNTDVGKAGGDGCECSQQCNGTVCPTTKVCTATVVNDCANVSMWCDRGVCKACQQGKYNCDGINDCESSTSCSSGGCELLGSKTCGSQSKYCDASSKTCKPCATGTYNCSMNGGDCECTKGCNGTACQKECTSATGCGDTGKFCDFGKCKACPTGKYNCNSKDYCECSGGCNGTQCKGTTACDYSDTNVCSGDTSKWCYQSKCTSCTSGYFNCNNTKGCECDSKGCNGTACAGTCSGGECP